MVFSKLIYTFLVSMIPAVEVKGAIPFGMALQLAPWHYLAVFLSYVFWHFLHIGFMWNAKSMDFWNNLSAGSIKWF